MAHDESERIVFMSAQDRMAEHHELVLAKGRVDGTVVQQISFRCASLQDVRDYHRTLVEHDVPIIPQRRAHDHGRYQCPDPQRLEPQHGS